MKIKIAVVLIVLCFVCYAETHIPAGEVSGTWNIAGSPYLIESGINVPENNTLNIEPGVVITFINEWVTFNIFGSLIAIGTESDSIYFFCADTTDITEILFSDIDVTSQDASAFEYCDIRNCLIQFNNSSNITIESCIVADGEGLSLDNSSPTISNTLIDNNSKDYGGGIFGNNHSNPVITNVIISNNHAFAGGGLCFGNNSLPSFCNVLIDCNVASGGGGGLLIDSIDINTSSITGVEVCNNIANIGGGISISRSRIKLHDITISGNVGSEQGGGIYCNSLDIDGRDVYLENVKITENSCEEDGMGGGMVCISLNIFMSNCLISNNTSWETGGIYGANANLVLNNVTVTENVATDCYFVGGIGIELDSTLRMKNSILWNNSEYELFFYNVWSYDVQYSDIDDGGFQGIGNISVDPLFADSDYHLSNNSPCIDAGNADSLYYDIEDPANPGYALYPASGTITNDMGMDGGHGYHDEIIFVPGNDNNTVSADNNITLSNYPNPFNPSTTISFDVPQTALFATIEIYNIKGQKVKTLDCCNSFAAAPKKLTHSKTVTWDGTDQTGKSVSSGIYFARLKAGKTEASCKMLLLK